MSYQPNGNEKQKGKALAGNSQGSGTKYHQEHAGNVEGYGQPHPVDGTDTGSMNINND
ncbi:hypothetical protein [Neobacillus sp. Marseille-QA0830]